jgi:hypothetical protein
MAPDGRFIITDAPSDDEGKGWSPPPSWTFIRCFVLAGKDDIIDDVDEFMDAMGHYSKASPHS